MLSHRRPFVAGKMTVTVCKDRSTLGHLAAKAVADEMRALLTNQPAIRMVFAAAPSQNEFLAALGQEADINWRCVTAFQMDEYVGLTPLDEASFAHYLNLHLFASVEPGEVHRMNAVSSPERECERYADLISEAPIDIVCLGIGENGHLAFNDPAVADFSDPLVMKQVTLDAECRLQQVHDGCFPTVEDVPSTALTLTIPTLMSARRIFGVVPGETKRVAVGKTLHAAIAPDCPATVLREHANCHLFLDEGSYGGEEHAG